LLDFEFRRGRGTAKPVIGGQHEVSECRVKGGPGSWKNFDPVGRRESAGFCRSQLGRRWRIEGGIGGRGEDSAKMVENVDQNVTRRGSWDNHLVVVVVGRGLVSARGRQEGVKVNEEENRVMENGVRINGDGL
jgi:hypothetical protein